MRFVQLRPSRQCALVLSLFRFNFCPLPLPPSSPPLFLFIFPFVLLLLPHPFFCGTSLCPAGQIRFGPCIGGQCPPTCPGVCTCVGGLDCCTNQNAGGDPNAGGISAGGSSSSLTRLLLALLLGTGRPGLPALRLALCRDNALNCPMFLTYCQLPPYSLCMYFLFLFLFSNFLSVFIGFPPFWRIHCTATCGGCGDDTMGLLLAQLLFGGLTASATLSPPLASAQLAIREKMPRIREIEEMPKAKAMHEKDTTTKCPAGEKRNGTTKSPQKAETIHHHKKKGGTRRMPSTNLRGQATRQTTTAHPTIGLQQFAVPPGLAIPKQQQQQQMIRTLTGRGREGPNILMRERDKLVTLLMRRFMGG